MLEEKGGWLVANVKNANWYRNPGFGLMGMFERRDSRFPHHGVRIWILEPDQSNCRYHRENAQEDLLVLSGECRLLVNEEERMLQTWDSVHCPPGVSHVFVGAGDAPCAILMIGPRPAKHEIYYPAHEPARRFNAEAPEPTQDPKVAYGDCEQWEEAEAPDWPIR
jgi:uncharacterized cupin superfamily protein